MCEHTHKKCAVTQRFFISRKRIGPFFGSDLFSWFCISPSYCFSIKSMLYISFSDGIATKETRAIKANVPSKMNVKKKRLERTIRDVWIWIRDNENWNLKPFRLAADVIF